MIVEYSCTKDGCHQRQLVHIEKEGNSTWKATLAQIDPFCKVHRRVMTYEVLT